MPWDEANEFPVDLVKELGRMGLMGSFFPMSMAAQNLAMWTM